ncbi:MAG: spermidine/putrescine ABC transporter substrate-binding protein [Hyphomicrobiales bacterium]
MWGTVGLGYRKSETDGAPASWKWGYESDPYAGQIALVSEVTTLIQMTAKYLGYPLSTLDPVHLKRIEELLIAQKPAIKVFAEDNGQDLLASDEVAICQEWNGDILQAMREDADLAYVVPKEGSLIWQDCLCIPKDTPHPRNAHRFLDCLNDPAVNAAIAAFIQYATPNGAARKLMSADYNDNPAIFPAQSVLDKSETAKYPGGDGLRLYNETFTRIMAA